MNKKTFKQIGFTVTLVFLSLLLTLPRLRAQELPPAVQSNGQGISRNTIEQGQNAGFLFTDVKGIKLQFGGFIQADFIHDFMDMGNKYGFQPSTINIPSVTEGTSTFSVRQSRFSFTAFGPTDSRGRSLKAFLEMDFFGSENGTPRIRHAYIQHGKWIMGQTWSNFMDNTIWPNILDYWGPNAFVWTRQVQLRFTQRLNKLAAISFSLEKPGCDITVPTGWISRTNIPDASIAYVQNFSKNSLTHLRLAGLFHPIDYKEADGTNHTSVGYAVNFTGNIDLRSKNDIKFQFAYGKGYAKYSEGIGGQGYDAFVKHGDMTTIPLLSTFLFYDVFFTQHLGSSIGAGYLHLYDNEAMGPTALNSTVYSALDITYYFTTYFKIGWEALYGRRENIDKENASNLRLQFSAFFNF